MSYIAQSGAAKVSLSSNMTANWNCLPHQSFLPFYSRWKRWKQHRWVCLHSVIIHSLSDDDCWLSGCSTSLSQWKWQGFHLCKKEGCGATTHPECHMPFLVGDAENSNLGAGRRFSSRHQKDTSVTGAKKKTAYKVSNELGCTHKDPNHWKYETCKAYVQKSWRERQADKDLVNLNCLHCCGPLEEKPKLEQQG